MQRGNHSVKFSDPTQEYILWVRHAQLCIVHIDVLVHHPSCSVGVVLLIVCPAI